MNTPLFSPQATEELNREAWQEAKKRVKPKWYVAEQEKCRESPVHFVETYCRILNVTEEAWIPFTLWPAQREILDILDRERFVVILKARQLGLTWLCLCFQLWLMLFRPISTVGIFSRIETDAQELLDVRLKGIYDRLPDWMKAERVMEDNKSRWELSNGSVAMSFSTTGGRQYTFSHILVDEADFQPDLSRLLLATRPTVDAGGKFTLLSTPDKGKPDSLFKRVYRQAKQHANEYHAVFLPWYARPDRDDIWYEEKKQDCLANTAALDDLHQEYPATDTEALASRTFDKRIPAPWIEACYVEMEPLGDIHAPVSDVYLTRKLATWPTVPGLEVYGLPDVHATYVLGADPAEGNPTSDDSALTVLNHKTGEEVATCAGKFEPVVFAAYIDAIGQWYNNAALMVERNNHGHAVIAWLNDNSSLSLLAGHDDRTGWLSSSLGKATLYNECADGFRNKNVALHSFATYTQLAAIEGSTLRAPENMHDDRADSFALAHVGRIANEVQKEAGVW